MSTPRTPSASYSGSGSWRLSVVARLVEGGQRLRTPHLLQPEHAVVRLRVAPRRRRDRRRRRHPASRTTNLSNIPRIAAADVVPRPGPPPARPAARTRSRRPATSGAGPDSTTSVLAGLAAVGAGERIEPAVPVDVGQHEAGKVFGHDVADDVRLPSPGEAHRAGCSSHESSSRASRHGDVDASVRAQIDEVHVEAGDDHLRPRDLDAMFHERDLVRADVLEPEDASAPCASRR